MERPESAPAPGERRVYVFGEFRVDPVRRRLLRGNDPIAVTSKAFSLLVVLLERRGEVVEKEELFRRVWPDTYVTEANLTQNISSLRKALGERAGDKRHILTVPGRGYTFVADVREESVSLDASGVFPLLLPKPPAEAPAAPAAEPAEPESAEKALDETLGPAPSPLPAAPPQPRTWMRRPGLLLAGGILLLALAGVLLLPGRPGAPPPEKAQETAAAAAVRRTAVVVLGFKDAGNPKNAEEAAWLGVALSEMLSTELSAGRQARLISGESVTRVRQSIESLDTGNLSDADLKRLRTILGADLVVIGSYLVLDQQGGRQIRLDVRVLELPAGTEVAAVSEAGHESDLFEIVSQAGARLRQTLGLNELSPGQSRAVQALHPSVPEAAQLTAQGLERLRAFDPVAARGFLERAAEIEPGSAPIHALLARAWYDLGDDDRSLEEARLALELSRSLPREERLAIEARFYAAGKQWPQAIEVYRSLWTFFPDDIDHGLQLATALINAGRSREALGVLASVRRVPLGREDPRIDLEEARAAVRLADMATLERAAAAAEAKARRSGERLALARALVMQGNGRMEAGKPQEAAARFREAEALARAIGHPWTAGMALSNLGGALLALGDLDEAELRHQQALDIARQLGSSVGIAAQLYTLALLHQERGELSEALRLLEEARVAYVEVGDRLMQGRSLAGMAPIFLRQGNVEAARRSAEEAVAAAREVGNRADEARALDVLAAVLSWQGEIAGAQRQLDAALQLLRGVRKPALATAVLASSADVLARLGNLDLARRRLDQAVAVDRRAGDRMASGVLLGSRARFILRSGDMAQARALSETQLRLARETGARVFEAWALHELGRTQRLAGDLQAANTSFRTSLRRSNEMGDVSRSAVTRLELARLMISLERPAEAAGLARAVAAWAAPRGSRWLEAQALAVAVEALLREGRTTEAVEAGERIRELVRTSQDLELILLTSASLARSDAAAGGAEGAVGDLREAIARAERSGLVAAALEARLALGEIEIRFGRGDQTLRDLQRDAAAYGFKDLARRAGLRPAG